MDQPSSVRAMLPVLWRLGWPLAITMQIAALAEAIVLFWLGHLLGPPALAVDATMRSVFLCAGWAMFGVATGVSVLVSQSVGAKDGRAPTLALNGVVLALLLWVVAVAIVLPLNEPFGALLASPEVSAAALQAYYLPWLLLAFPGLGVIQVLLQVASGAGWTRLTLARSLVDLALMAAAVPIMIGGLDLGVRGAPIATGVVQLAVAAFLWRSLQLHRARWAPGEGAAARPRLQPRLWLQILDIGMPPQLARVAMLGSYAYLVQRVALDGRSAVAAFGVAVPLMFMAAGATSAMGRATAIAVGQAVGAKAWGRVRVAIRGGLVLGIGVSLGLALIFVAAGEALASVFADEGAVRAHAGATLRIVAVALPFTALSQVLLFVFTALKASKSAGMIGIVADAAGIAFALAWPGESRLDAAAWSIVLSNAVRALLYVGLWRFVVARKLAAP